MGKLRISQAEHVFSAPRPYPRSLSQGGEGQGEGSFPLAHCLL